MDNRSETDGAPAVQSFDGLGLSEATLKTIRALGYETPTQIQTRVIPKMMAGVDIMGQAQTGTGKTAAFALPVVSRVDVKKRAPQCLVLAPTRELAIQVADSFTKYSAHIKGFQTLAIYGGQPIWTQIKHLKQGVHVVVGTPGRVMDHLRNGTLDLSSVSVAILDEADEMLRMGFIEDVEWILERIPKERQTSVFSATLPPQVRRIAERYMRSPEEICIAKRTCSADTVKQSALTVGPHFKLEALTRILEAESFDAVIVFVRTKLQTTELADKLVSRGYDAAPLSGDLKQSARERTIEQLKSGKLDIIVATDVAARGLDVERLSLVVNYDMPYDPEDYIHRIGRTGRAGREGRAILFSTPREFKLLKAIERATHRQIDEYELPTVGSIRAKRIADLKNKILEASTALDPEETALFSSLIKQFQVEAQADAVHIAVALLKLVQAEKPLLVKECERPAPQRRDYRDDRGGYRGKGDFKPKGKWRHDDGPKREPWKERRFNKKGNGGPSQQSKRQDVFE